MLKMVDGTGIIGVDMICPLGVSAPQPPNYDRVELEGAGMLVLPNSLDAPLERLELGGKTEQVSTRGVNLWSKESKITFTATKQVVFDTPIPAGDYVVSANVTSSDKDGAVCLMLFYYTDSGSKGANLTRTGRSSAKITFTSDVKHVVLYAGQNANGSANDTATFADIQLEKGSTATAYEPYTGGKPSPSPEYPQEIKNSGKWNEEKQKYEVEVEISGNFFDITKVRDTKKLKNNKDGSLTITNSATEGLATLKEICPDLKVDESYVMRLESTGTSYISIYGIVWDTGQSKTITQTMLDSTVFFYGKDGSTVVIKNIRITRNTGKNMEYTPYRKPQLLTLTSDRPLTKWDRLVEQGGEIGWLYGSKIYVVTGNEVFESRDSYNIESYTNRYFILNDLLMENDALKPLAYMKCLRNVQYVYSANIFEEGFETNKNQFHIKLSNDRVGILASDDHAVRTAKFSEYMKKIHKNGNPIEILYATTDTVFLPLPQEEQNAIRALKTYYPTTVITVDGGELYPDIKVTYRKEI